MFLLGFRRKLTALTLCKSIESAIQWFQIHHRITFATIQNPAVYLSGARVSIFSTLVPWLTSCICWRFLWVPRPMFALRQISKKKSPHNFVNIFLYPSVKNICFGCSNGQSYLEVCTILWLKIVCGLQPYMYVWGMKMLGPLGNKWCRIPHRFLYHSFSVYFGYANCHIDFHFHIEVNMARYNKCSNILNTSYLPIRPRQTKIWLLLKKLSDQGLPCLLFRQAFCDFQHW